MAPIRALVISHSAVASGAPIALLRIMHLCVADGILRPIFVVRGGGDLIASFEALGPTVQLSTRTENLLIKIATRLPFATSALALAESVTRHRLRRICHHYKAEVVYVNSATQGTVVSALQHTGLPIITHVHELGRLLRRTVGCTGIKAVIDQSHMLVAGTSSVRTMLLAHGAESGRIVDVPLPIVDAGDVSAADRSVMRRGVFRVDNDTILVVACGWPSWTKGPDVFLQVAKAVIASAPRHARIAFRWLGGTLPNVAMTTLIDDIACLGLEEHVQVIPYTPNAARLLAAADILVSTSREDSGPLVVLEAAASGCPVVCFEDAGGAAELARVGGALAVPYLDAKAMADTVLALIESPEDRELLGDKARMIVKEHNAPHVVAEKMATVLRRCAVSHNDPDYD